MSDERAEEQDAPEPPPPLMGSWSRLYALVIGFLVLQIALFWALSEWAA